MKTRSWLQVGLAELPVIAAEMVQWLGQAPPVWRFDGQMGAGKTTFIAQLCKALGVVDRVQSPTFSLVNEYSTSNGQLIYHFDFYRIESPREAEGIGTTEYLDSGHLCLIEWPERIEPLLPDAHVQVLVEPQPDNSRTIQVIIHGTTH